MVFIFRILKHFHTSPEEYSLIFTSGATGAIKLLLENFIWDVDGDEFFESYEEKLQKSAFVYTRSNHTSVVGGREIAAEKGVSFYCLDVEDADVVINGTQNDHFGSNNSLFVYPAMCNFSGRKYPLDWVQKVQNGALDGFGLKPPEKRNSKWFCLLDAATFCSTNELNLSEVKPDFVCVSFYKIFGYPTGLGALIVRNSSAHVLDKKYFGGGTVDVSVTTERFHRLRSVFHER